MKADKENLEKQIEVLRNQIIQMERLSFIGQMTAGIMHEIKNPLNFVNNFARLSLELIQDMSDISNELSSKSNTDFSELDETIGLLKSNIDKISEHGQRAQRIVQGILAQAGTQKAIPVSIKLNQLIEEYTKLAYHGVRGENKNFNATINYNFDKNIDMVNLVEKNFSRVILNIVNNACYAVSKKKEQLGEVYNPVIEISTYKIDNDVVVKIRDNGPGIPEHIRNKIFESFFSTKPIGEGTGLGLSLSYDTIVNEHKGKLEVNSIEGEFAEFVISIPLFN